MDHSAIGLGGLLLRLGAEPNWHRMYSRLIENFDTQALATRQAAALEEAGVPAAVGHAQERGTRTGRVSRVPRPVYPCSKSESSKGAALNRTSVFMVRRRPVAANPGLSRRA